MEKSASVNNINHEIIKLLGHGKGGYSLGESCGVVPDKSEQEMT